MLFQDLQTRILSPEALDVIMDEFITGLKNAGDDNDGQTLHFEARIKELDAEIRNLVTAIAKGKSATSAFLESIHERESELKQLKALVNKQSKERPEFSREALTDFASRRLLEICELIKIDVARAKTEFSKHVSEIVLRPDLEDNAYVVEGQWDLLGEYALKICPEYLDGRGDVRMVPGGGVEPPRGVNLGGF